MVKNDTESGAFVAHIVELLSVVGNVRAKRMFGGHGIFLDDMMFALIADDVLYLKANGQTAAAFESAGAEPFVYTGKGKPVTMSYWSAPDGTLDNAVDIEPWAQLAVAAARAAKAAKPNKASKPKSKRKSAKP